MHRALYGLILVSAMAMATEPVGGASAKSGRHAVPWVPGQVAQKLPAPLCTGEYADDLSLLPQAIREFDGKPQAQYAYCVRNTAVYECLSYGNDGNVRHVRKKATSHGTAFGYKLVNGETLLLTNQHVAELPAVTDDEHPVEDVPNGCKRVSDTLRIVDKDSDAYDRDDIPLTRVVTDIQMDVAVLKARQVLPILPWAVGRSAALRERNVVDVRGFPLGAFQATNAGKVVSAYDHDDFKDWDHDDFVVDALLSPGHSGSPVLALSCKTGQFELVGLYHAGYTNGSALNVVIGIDQVRDLMSTLKKAPRVHAESSLLDAAARSKLLEEVSSAPTPFFPFGGLTAALRARADGALVYEIFGKEFPLKAHPVLVMEDLPPLGSDGFGEMGRVWFGGPNGLKVYGRSELDAEAQSQVNHWIEHLRRNAVTAFAYRAATRATPVTRERVEQMTRLERGLRRASSSQHEASQAAAELAERLSPHGTDVPLAISDAYAPPTLTRRVPSGADEDAKPFDPNVAPSH